MPSIEPATVTAMLPDDNFGDSDLLNSLAVGVYICDNDGFIKKFNDRAVRIWGRAPETDKEKWCGAYKSFTGEGKEFAVENGPMAMAIREGKAINIGEIILERADGSRVHVIPNPSPLFDAAGNVIGAVNILVDITDLVSDRNSDLLVKNEELRKSEERYHKMIEEVEDYAILLMDKSGIIQNWNRGAEKIKGYKEEEIVGKNFRVFYLPEDQERGLPDKLIADAYTFGKALHEGWRVRKDGSVFWGSIVITALHDSENNVVGFSKVTRDLTQKKLAEDKIRQYTNELEFQNRELEQFAYAAAHDMKEPLRKIRFYTNLVYDNFGEQLPEKERDYLKRSINAASRMQTLIDDLLTYSKTASQEMEYKKVDLGKVIAEIQMAHYETIRELNADIQTGNLPVIDGVSFQVMQLFDNLLGNALKYHHPERRPHIRIFSEMITGPDPETDLVKEGETYYRITVADNGIGFDSQYSEKVFDLFQRLHDKVNYSGTGIGLALCRKIIQSHKGFMIARGEEGKGASFMVYFPATEG